MIQHEPAPLVKFWHIVIAGSCSRSVFLPAKKREEMLKTLEERKMVKAGSISMVHLRLKLVRVIHRHKQMKSAFNNLRSQIKTGLIEAEDVFASLSIPLMKLVGLKTDQMAQQGRSSTILTAGSTPPPPPQLFRKNAAPGSSSFSWVTRDLHINRFEEGERYSGTGKKLIIQQRFQLQQLVNLLRRIESRVNSRQNNLLDTLEQHQIHLNNLFHNSIRYLSCLHHQTNATTNQEFLLVTLKLLHTTFKHVASALASVHNGVEDLITELAQHMCCPMTDYAKSLKAEMEAGALIRLVAVVEKMEGALRLGQVELDQARIKAQLEEESKLQALAMLRDSEQRELEALNKLRDSENKRMAMKEFVGFLLDAKKNSKKPFASKKLLVKEVDEAGDEELLWDLLKEKKQVKVQAIPVGTKELWHVESSSKNSARSDRPVTRSFRKGLCPSPDVWPQLGSSPCVVDQTIVHKQAPPLLRIRKGTPHQ